MEELTFKNEEYGVYVKVLNEKVVEIYNYCNESYPNETGGIFLGEYLDEHTARIKVVLGPTADSTSGRSKFNRGILGLNKILEEYWEMGMYYLGEWHFHPNGNGIPSQTDVDTMFSISVSEKYKCPESILMIISGMPNKYNEGVYIFTSNALRIDFNKI